MNEGTLPRDILKCNHPAGLTSGIIVSPSGTDYGECYNCGKKLTEDDFDV